MDVTVYGPLRSAIGGKETTLQFSGGTVDDAIDTLVSEFPRAAQYLYGADNDLRPSVRISVNGDRVESGDQCQSDASIKIMPAVQGGSR